MGIGIVLGLAFLMAALASRSASAAPAGTSPELAHSVDKIVRTGDPSKMMAASQAAAQAGDHKLSDHLALRAADANVMSPHAMFPSPFPSVPSPAWSAFVRALRGPDPQAVTPANHLGLFGFSMPKLVDLGLATNPHKVKRDGRTIWEADFIPPTTLESFLSSPAQQYATFVKAAQHDLSAILQGAPEAVGTEIDGKPATPSGLLAVVHQAGLANLKTWIADAETRKKYPHTTAAFHRLNGIF